MKISIDIPDEWADVLRQSATEAGYKSVSEFVRALLDQSPTVKRHRTNALPPLVGKSWGGKRQVPQDAHLAQVEQHAQDEHLEPARPKFTPPTFATPRLPRNGVPIPPYVGRKTAKSSEDEE